MAAASPSVVSKPINSLRPFNAQSDLEAVADLIEVGFNETLDDSGRRYLQQMRATAKNLRSFNWLGVGGAFSATPMSGYVWEEDGRVVGNLSLIPYLVGLKRYFLIANVVVHPEFRGRGIGRSLTARALAHAREHGAPEAWLHVRPDNPVAIGLYESLGFIERARRTTWQAQGEPASQPGAPGLEIRPRRGADWNLQRLWLERNYPRSLSWQLPFNPNSLRAGVLGGLYRFFNNTIVDQWAVSQNGKLIAVAALQSGLAYPTVLWLAAPPDADDTALAAILRYARKVALPRNPLILDYPDNQSVTALEQEGFINQHSLIWMSVDFNG